MEGSVTSASTSKMAESVFVQGIRKALSPSEIIKRLSQATALKRRLLESLRDKIREREQNSNFCEDVSKSVKLPFGFLDKDDSRHWITHVFMEDDESTSEDSGEEITEEDYRHMLKHHLRRKRCAANFASDSYYSRYMHYSTDFMNSENRWHTHKNSFRKVKKKKVKPEVRSKWQNSPNNTTDAFGEEMVLEDDAPGLSKRSGSVLMLKKKKLANIAAMRRKHWKLIAKKDIPKAYRVRTQMRGAQLASLRRVSRDLMKKQRANAAMSVKVSKDKYGRARRITREMQLFWKKYSKVEKVHRKKAEKHALEQIRLDEEMREAKRQQRKLNFLISQTELFAHFMSKKFSKVQESVESDARIKSIMHSLENDYKEHSNTSCLVKETPAEENLDGQYYCNKAMENVKQAMERHRSQTAAFNISETRPSNSTNSGLESDVPQPSLFKGLLKSYQLKGMNWLVDLYEQGINGILADEMGLGKTVQTIAFLGHLAQKLNIWGPFLVVAPASTLNNWHQEFTKFFPDFKVLPYWGNPADRKVLRKFWNQKASHHSSLDSAPFHILITSYQLVISDVRYFQRIKWQYMVLDEAQALKSTASVRWKILLEFNCRNRLLLTGTPIQNTMAELWALLHFIMPSLFDSHGEFNEWFSKDIESHIENKSNIDETQLSRLHMILKPFMLRRIKRDVENELSEKIEIRVHCGLAPRQKSLYDGVKRNIKLEDLLKSTGSTYVSTGSGHTLMNLVMQFRKICNHPDLFDRREVISPFNFGSLPSYIIPKLIYREGILSRISHAKRRLLYNDLNVHHPSNVNESIPGEFSFLHFLPLSVYEYWRVSTRKLHFIWWLEQLNEKIRTKIYMKQLFHNEVLYSLSNNPDSFKQFNCSSPFFNLVFTQWSSTAYTHHDSAQIAAGTELIFLPISLARIFCPPVTCTAISLYCCDRNFCNEISRPVFGDSYNSILYGPSMSSSSDYCLTLSEDHTKFSQALSTSKGLTSFQPVSGWSNINIPDKETLVTDSGKLYALDVLLRRLKNEGHRVLVYSQMTRMIDILEEYMWYRQHTYIRLDGSSRISERRDMVADFQSRSDIFAFLLSTRAGGLGINLTAADTVIFYDSDWNPTVDQQAMDRAHRLGQTKQVTVYRLVCEGTVDERILQRAEEKSAIQRMVIAGGSFKPDILKTKEVVSLLLDDEQLLNRLKMKREENRGELLPYKGKKRGRKTNVEREAKRLKQLQEQGVIGTVTDAASGNLTITHSESNSSTDPDLFDSKFFPGSMSQDADSTSIFGSSPASPASEASGNSDLKAVDDDTIVVDDVMPITKVSTPTSSRARGRGRGRPRIRPLPPESTRRRTRATPLQGVPTRKRSGRVKKLFTGRVAAMAGARAGAAAASAATYAAYGYGLEPNASPTPQQKTDTLSNQSSVT